MSRRPKDIHLCIACHRHVFAALVKRHPLASLAQLGQLAEPEIGWAAHYRDLGPFLKRCGIKMLTPTERADWRGRQAQREAVIAAKAAKRRARKLEPLLRPEHLAIARNASVFSLGGEQ